MSEQDELEVQPRGRPGDRVTPVSRAIDQVIDPDATDPKKLPVYLTDDQFRILKAGQENRIAMRKVASHERRSKFEGTCSAEKLKMSAEIKLEEDRHAEAMRTLREKEYTIRTKQNVARTKINSEEGQKAADVETSVRLVLAAAKVARDKFRQDCKIERGFYNQQAIENQWQRQRMEKAARLAQARFDSGAAKREKEAARLEQERQEELDRQYRNNLEHSAQLEREQGEVGRKSEQEAQKAAKVRQQRLDYEDMLRELGVWYPTWIQFQMEFADKRENGPLIQAAWQRVHDKRAAGIAIQRLPEEPDSILDQESVVGGGAEVTSKPAAEQSPDAEPPHARVDGEGAAVDGEEAAASWTAEKVTESKDDVAGRFGIRVESLEKAIGEFKADAVDAAKDLGMLEDDDDFDDLVEQAKQPPDDERLPELGDVL